MRFDFRRAYSFPLVVVLTLAANACAAVLGIDNVTLRDDAGIVQDATIDAPSPDGAAADSGIFSCSDPNQKHELCADFEEGNPHVTIGADGETVILNAIVDGGTLGVASFGSGSAASLQVSANPISPADAAVEPSFLVYDSTTTATTFVLDFDVQTPNSPVMSGHVDYPVLQVNDLDGGSAIQFYLAINAENGAEIVAASGAASATPLIVDTSPFPDTKLWMHVELRISLQSNGSARLLAFIGNQVTTPVLNKTLVNTPVQGHAHLQLGIVASGTSTPEVTVQIDNVTLDTN